MTYRSDRVDRLAPTRQPPGRPRGYQRWRDLLFLHWPVPKAAIRQLVPPELALDAHDGRHYVGIVAFAMQGVRPAWAPEALAFDFLETNVRTYVVSKHGEPGVFFFSLDAASRVAVRVARAMWSLPYFFASIQSKRTGDRWEYSVERTGEQPADFRAEWRMGDPAGTAPPGTLDHFLIERYLLFADRTGTLLRGRVHHCPYPLRRVELETARETLLGAAGLPASEGPPPLVHASDGVDVQIYDLDPV